MYCRLGTYKTLRKRCTVGFEPTKSLENTVQSALCLQNASKAVYSRLCAYKTLRILSALCLHNSWAALFEFTVRNQYSNPLTLLLFTMFHIAPSMDMLGFTLVYIYIYIYVYIYTHITYNLCMLFIAFPYEPL